MMRIGIGFSAIDEERPLCANRVTALGLHGVLFRVLRSVDRWGATWLHDHDSPKPYSLAPYFTENNEVAGIQINAITTEAEMLLSGAWQEMKETETILYLGDIPFIVREVELVPSISFEQLTETQLYDRVRINVRTPMTFRQGHGHLPLPLPRNLFIRPERIWNVFAPPAIRKIPSDWLAWCNDDVFIIEHDIQTVDMTVSWKEPACTGFIGEVVYQAKSDSVLYKSLWQSLIGLLPYSGAGYKTTMGMGAVEVIQQW